MHEQQEITDIQTSQIEVLIVSNGKSINLGLEAFKSILEEEGTPFSIIDNQKLITMDPNRLVLTKPALLYPDGTDAYIDQDTEFWMKKYINAGGHLLTVYDTGIKDINGRYRLDNGVLDELIGLRTNLYREKRNDTFLNGPVTFEDFKTAAYFGIPKGKLDTNATLVGYIYGELTFPYADNYLVDHKNSKVYAWGKRHDGTRVPLIVHKIFGKGEILHVNLPLAQLKGNSDDLLARSVIRTFLFKMVKIPHLLPSPYGKGGLVINWHIDSNIELIVQPWFLENGYLDPHLKYSMHITAGPDCDAIGDGKGFDATGKGRKIVENLLRFGTIGSHGGWAHNWFAKNLEEKNLTDNEIQTYIKKNDQALSSITGYQITEYSAPVGVFPQPLSTHILKELNMTNYYYPGDTGSAPNRTFYNGKMVSKNIIAFPVMTFDKYASLAELEQAHYTAQKTEDLLIDLIDYTIKNRTIRLFYSHPYDIFEGMYQDVMKSFIAYAVKKQEEGELLVETMSYFRDFILKLVSTEKTFSLNADTLEVNIRNTQVLDGIVIAMPKNYQGQRITRPGEKSIFEDENYYYIPIESGKKTFRNRLLIDQGGSQNEK